MAVNDRVLTSLPIGQSTGEAESGTVGEISKYSNNSILQHKTSKYNKFDHSLFGILLVCCPCKTLS